MVDQAEDKLNSALETFFSMKKKDLKRNNQGNGL